MTEVDTINVTWTVSFNSGGVDMPKLLEKITYEDLYTFDNFDVDRRNRFAYLAAKDVANTPDTPYNPLFFYGNRYDGKTHLLKAMGNHIQSVNPEFNVVYARAEDFYYEYLYEIRNSAMHLPKSFREKYRNADVLLLDDIDYLTGKNNFSKNYKNILGELNTPVEEFFHTFETLYNRGKRIVLAANRQPKDLGDLDEMFGKRLEMGLVIGMRAG